MIKITNAALAKGIAALLAISAMAPGTVFAGTVDAGKTDKDVITQEAAETAAIEDAGVDKTKVTNLYSHLDKDDGRYVYDIEFYVGNVEYEYEVLAADGTILEKDKETKTNTGGTKNTGDTKKASDTAGTEKVKKDLITQEAAEAAAIKDAGVDKEKVTNMFTHLDRDDGRYVYDIEFYVGNVEYEYEVLAADGTILERDKETKKNDTTKSGTAADSKDQITQEAAEAAAIKDAGVDKDKVTNMNTHLDEDDGRYVYDIEFYVDNVEYEYEVLAADGTILERDKEIKNKNDKAADSSTADASAAGEYIGIDRAKEIALKDAGFAEKDVVFTTAKFDNDDDGPEYEIEFLRDNVEYEYDIDAATGKIISSSSEIDDD